MGTLNKFEEIKEEIREEYCSKNPILYQKITSYEEMNYLNLIDRTFYLIRLREELYFNHQEEFQLESSGRNNKIDFKWLKTEERIKNYSRVDFIFELDYKLVSQLRENIHSLIQFHELQNIENLLKRPSPILLGEYNLLLVSPFLIDLDSWFTIILNDISKVYKADFNSNDKSSSGYDYHRTLKTKLKTFSIELERRIGTGIIKDYKNSFLEVPEIIDTLSLGYVLQRLDFKDILGSENLDSLIKQSILYADILNLKRKIKIYANRKTASNCFNYYLDKIMNIPIEGFKEDLMYFIDFFSEAPSHDNIEKLKAPYLSFLQKENLEDFLRLLKFLREKKVLHYKNEELAAILKEITNIDYTKSSFKTKHNKCGTLIKDHYRRLNSFLC